MLLKKPWVAKLRNRLLVLALIVFVVFLLYRHKVHSTVAISHYTPEQAVQFLKGLSFSDGTPQTETMAYGGTQWYKMAEQPSGSLWMDPATGRIAVKTASGAVWLSNPSSEDLDKDKTKGQWKNNELSPILVNYLDLEKKSADTANTIDSKATIHWRSITSGVGIEYTLDTIGVSVYLEYTMDNSGLVVHLPQEGVKEGDKDQILSLSVLPFFGAALDDEKGYLFVPDGPGGLIDFGQARPDLTAPYDYPVYGNDESVPTVGEHFNRTEIDYPVFGMKRGDRGFLSVIEDGDTQTHIVAMPATLRTSFNNVYASFTWRNYYTEQKGLNPNNTQSVYEKSLNVAPLTMRYLFLDQDSSDYVGMAKRYRQYLTDTRQLKAQTQSGEPPLMLDFIMAASEQPTPLGSNTVVVSTFSEVQKIVDDLYAEGIHKMRISLRGWQNGGFAGSLPNRFPMESKLGGTELFQSLQQDLRQKQIPLTLDDDLKIGVDSLGSKFSPKSDGVRQITGKVMKYFQSGDFYDQALYYYVINPRTVVSRYLPIALDQWKKLSVDGVGLMDEFSDGLYSDYNPDRSSDRKTTAELMNQTLDSIRGSVGWAGTSNPYAFTIGHVDMFNYLPLDYNYDLVVNERVPFYPIVLHGLVNYTSYGGWMRNDPKTELLREIEYGALPYYNLTSGDVRDIQRTPFSMFVSGQYELVKSQLVSEYKTFADAERDIWDLQIEGHRIVTDGVYETTYQNGTRIIVNYNDHAYSGDGYEVKAMSYTVVKGGGAQ